jgi:hypothetical protein
MEALELHRDIDAIVNFLSHNEYTDEAKARASQLGVGLFTPREMFGALNFEGEAFHEYRLPELPG